MSYKIIGTCSICGGQVGVPTIWHGIYPPIPTCLSCGAVARDSGPVIPMRPRRPYWRPKDDTIWKHKRDTDAPTPMFMCMDNFLNSFFDTES